MPVRILIADDNSVFRKTLRQLLEGVDQWEIIEAGDGQEALSKCLEIRPRVVVLDLAMPVKDGLAAAREIAELLPETPILMCTMHMSAHVEAEALKSGIRKVLSKSDSSLLVPAIQQLLSPEQETSKATIPDTIPPTALPVTAAAATPVSPSPPAPDPTAAEPAPPLPKSVA